MIDDGTIFHLREGVYRLCSQERQLDWLTRSAFGFDVTIVEDTHDVAGLALQGPTSCAVLKAIGCTGVQNLKPFEIGYYPFAGTELTVSRTGFTGDLGYELWIDPVHALELWDALFEQGQDRTASARWARTRSRSRASRRASSRPRWISTRPTRRS